MDGTPETAKQAARRLSAAAVRDGYIPQSLHEYRDADGKPWCWRIRLKHPNGDKWMRPMKLNGHGFELGEPPALPDGKPLYRLPELIAADPAAPVFVVEGERCADTLAKLGIIATTSGSCSSADAADWTPLRGRTVTVWPDNDGPGAGYAAAVVAKLRGLQCDVRLIGREVVESLPDAGDVVDWIAQHHDATADTIRALPTTEPATDAATATQPQPQPLPRLPDVPPFPLELLPGPLKRWIGDAAERAQFQPDLAAVSSMVALGSVIGRKLGIRLKQYDDWTEYANIWGAIVGPPSALKSPAMREGERALKALQVAADDKHRDLQTAFEAENEVYQLRKKAKHAKAKDALKDSADAGIDLNAGAAPEAPIPRTYWTSNVNEASLGILLERNPNGLLIERDELSSLLVGLEDDSRADLRGMLLSGWSGNEGYRFDRVLRGTTMLPKFAVSILGGIQPGPLARYVRSAYTGERADGLLQRFQLIVWPDAAGFEYIDRYPDSNAREAVNALFQRVDTFDPLTIGECDPYGNSPPFVRLSPGAQARFTDWYTDFMRSQRGAEHDGNISGPLAAHFGKYPGAVGKLALSLHVADDPASKQVSDQTMIKALAWLQYLKPHAERVYHAIEYPETGAAELLLARLKRGDLPATFKARDLYRKGWSGLTDPKTVRAACRLLFDYAWLVEIDSGGETGGRPADPAYMVSPGVGHD